MKWGASTLIFSYVSLQNRYIINSINILQKHILLSINLLCVLLFNNAFSQWTVQDTNIGSSIRGITFLDSLNGWASTDSTIFLHTSNGGETWQIKSMDDSINYGIIRFYFTNKDIGYACAIYGHLYSTKDGGETWTASPQVFEIDFQDIYFVNDYEGWAVGQRYGNNFGRGMIVHTSDGGANWTKQLEIESTNPFEVRYFKAIGMKNNNVGWAIAGDYFDNFSPTYIYKTEDGGENWNVLTETIQGPARRLKIAAEDTMWVDGYGVTGMSTSVDGGSSWDKFSTSYDYISAISPENGNNGWGSYNDIRTGIPSILLYTTDRGMNWSVELEVNEIILDVENKGNYVWIGGTNGLIMRKNLITSVRETSLNNTPGFSLENNYPNPFNSQTVISYSLSFQADVELKIINMLGEVISTRNFLNQQEGNHRLIWDGKNDLGQTVSSGVYLYSITVIRNDSNSFKKVKKMILIY